MGLGDWLQSTLGFLGPGGLLVAIFLIFFVDAVVFPALPELFVVVFYFQLVDWGWLPLAAGGSLLALAILGDLMGNASLYAIVRWFDRRGRIPRRLASAMQRWTKFLVTSDERILLVNRVAPAVPFTGAFIAVCGWDLRKSLAFIAIGGAAKYALLLVIIAGLGVAFSPETARIVTLVAVVVLVGASVAAGQIRKRRLQGRRPD